MSKDKEILELLKEIGYTDPTPLRIDDIKPNTWNHNVMEDHAFKSLVNAIETKGFYFPILVIPDEAQEGKYIIVDGEHRWRAVKQLGKQAIPAFVLRDITIDQAKVLTINMNNIRGDFDMVGLAELLLELKNNGVDIVQEIAIPAHQLENLTAIPGFDWDSFHAEQEVKLNQKKEDKKVPKIKSSMEFVLTENQTNLVRKVLDMIGGDESSALLKVCSFYLDNLPSNNSFKND